MRSSAIALLILFTLIGGIQAQQGEKSIAGGLYVAFLPQRTVNLYDFSRFRKMNVGLEAIGQYNFTDKSAALLQIQLTRFAGQEYEYSYSPTPPHQTIIGEHPFSFLSLSLKGGYRYQFTQSGFYANVLAGIEEGKTGTYSETFFPVAVGCGKRFPIKDFYFIDVGIERISGGYVNRWNVRAVFSLLRRPKV